MFFCSHLLCFLFLNYNGYLWSFGIKLERGNREAWRVDRTMIIKRQFNRGGWDFCYKGRDILGDYVAYVYPCMP